MISPAKRDAVLAHYRNICFFCGEYVGSWLCELHHIVPKQEGGTDAEKNLAPCHISCHDTHHDENPAGSGTTRELRRRF